MNPTKELLEEIYSKHKKLLKNTNVVNRKCIIAFSAPIGAGKTTIARQLEEKFKAIRVNNDDIRKIILTTTHIDKANLQSTLIAYLKELFAKLSKDSNGTIIIDASLDRMYKELSQLATAYNFPLFIIRLEYSLETIKDRIRKRGLTVEDFLNKIDSIYGDFLKARENIPAQYIINETNCDDIQNLVDTIERFKDEL